MKLTDYEFRQLEAEAIRRGMNKSELIRSLIAQFPAPPKVGFILPSARANAELR
ncbi:ribbon-helix-helix protein, CopG family [Limnofasciculus baicalensis]|uniref:Ribbon-helix-helix domain-containing protein n=1 Tax=Limnofasciculus baicalensis BBK-W-15 TaxID=2699891 RepID=A0AAE3GVC4_9CYAN|nr:ribbon-helix-helix protein, CopG family [Limnofasciculus baicalensis]MCP2729262.1 ribbon-helix-helix domain-containing protein [Limnofasciculus baicalensis BBK-W-15]